MNIDGIAAIVTGGASGLGAATAEMLASQGAKVTLFDMNEEKGQQQAEKIGGKFIKVDVTNQENVEAAIAEAEAAHGIARVLVNCAGIATGAKTVGKEFKPHPMDQFRKTIDYGDFLKHLTIEPTLVDLLARIRPPLKTAIATNRTDTMQRLLEEFGLKDQFDMVVTSLDVTRPTRSRPSTPTMPTRSSSPRPPSPPRPGKW